MSAKIITLKPHPPACGFHASGCKDEVATLLKESLSACQHECPDATVNVPSLMSVTPYWQCPLQPVDYVTMFHHGANRSNAVLPSDEVARQST